MSFMMETFVFASLGHEHTTNYPKAAGCVISKQIEPRSRYMNLTSFIKLAVKEICKQIE